MNETIFSEILEGTAEGSFVYRDELVSAFMDAEPINKGHVLVVPNLKVRSVLDLEDRVAERLFKVAKNIARAIVRCGIPCDGINMFLADGEAAGQEVGHVHLHIVPRVKNDGFHLKFPDTGYFLADRKELDSVAASIQSELERLGKVVRA